MSDDDGRPAEPGTIAGATQRALRALNRSAPASSEPVSSEPVSSEPAVSTESTESLGAPTDDDVLAAEMAVAESDLSGPPVDTASAADTAATDTAPVAPTTPAASPDTAATDVAADDTDATAAPDVAATDAGPAGAAPGTQRGLYGALAIAVAVALVFAVVTGVLWWRAGHNSQRTTAEARDAVALQTRLDVASVTSSDFQHPTVTVASWLSHTAASGELHKSYASQQQLIATQLRKSQLVGTSVVYDVAVTGVDVGKGTATALAAVILTRTNAAGQKSSVPERLQAAMVRVDGQWKLSNLAAV